jgi:hypothetical protein
MAFYVKKPIPVEAIQINNNAEEIQNFIGDNGSVINDTHCTLVTINTLEGTMSATDGAYIIKGVAGEFYPCAKDIFESTYEEVKE